MLCEINLGPTENNAEAVVYNWIQFYGKIKIMEVQSAS